MAQYKPTKLSFFLFILAVSVALLGSREGASTALARLKSVAEIPATPGSATKPDQAAIETTAVTDLVAAADDVAVNLAASKIAAASAKNGGGNVVLITVDTLRADFVGAYGGVARTPTLDGLAERGWLFEQCISTSMLTTPSHASIMTSLYPKDHGVYGNREGIQNGLPTLASRMREKGYRTLAVVGFPHLNDDTSNLGQGFDRITPAYSRERSAEETAAHALRLIDGVPEGEKFFIWVHFVDPHAPYVFGDDSGKGASPRTLARSKIDVPVAQMKRVRQVAPGFQKKHKWFKWALKKFENTTPLVRRYISEIEATDKGIATLMNGLQRRGHGDDTSWVVTSDHGENLGEHDLFFHHGGLFRETVHVPLIFAGPEIEPATIRGFVQTIDIAPTVLALSGAQPLQPSAGIDLQKVVDGRQKAREFAFSEHIDAQMVSVRRGDETLILHRKSGRPFPNYRMKAGRMEYLQLGNDGIERHQPMASRASPELEVQLHHYLSNAMDLPTRPALAQDIASLRALGYVE